MFSLGALALLATLVSPPSSAGAAQGLFLTWDDCAQGASASPDRVFDCLTSTGQSDLFAAFTVAAPVDSVLGIEIVIDLIVASPVLTDWWGFQPSGCRVGLLLASDAFGRTACEDVWQNQTSGGVIDWTDAQPRGMPNQARLRVAFGVPSNLPRGFDESHMYYACRVVVPHAFSTGPSSCFGCDVPACLVLNTVRLRRPPRPEGAPDADVLIEAPGPGSSNWATWQGGASANCQTVPARNRTWGAVKSLYR